MGWRSRWGFGALGLAFALAVVLPASGQARAERRAYGEHLVGRYQLAPELIARYAALAAGQGGHEHGRAESLLADRAPWIGPALKLGVGHNPYTLVLSASGVARQAGEAYAHWQAGWEVQESYQARREVLAPVARATRQARAAGEQVTMTVHSLPVSFRGERLVAPLLGLVQTRNFEITAVEVEVWSGSAPLALATPSRGTVLALAGAGLLMLLPLGRRRRAEPVVDARTSRLPAAAEPSPVAAAAPPSVAAPEAPVAPDQGQRVRDNLLQILRAGLVVPTVWDESRPPRRRRPKAPPPAH